MIPNTTLDDVIAAPTDLESYVIDEPIPVRMGDVYVIRTRRQFDFFASRVSTTRRRLRRKSTPTSSSSGSGTTRTRSVTTPDCAPRAEPQAMLDLKLIREDPEGVAAALGRRGEDGAAEVIGRLISLDGDRRGWVTDVNELKATRNRVSKEVGERKKGGRARGRSDRLDEDPGRGDYRVRWAGQCR